MKKLRPPRNSPRGGGSCRDKPPPYPRPKKRPVSVTRSEIQMRLSEARDNVVQWQAVSREDNVRWYKGYVEALEWVLGEEL